MDAALDAQAATKARDAKAAVRRQWDLAAAGWNEHAPAVGAWLREATDAMIDLAGIRAGSRVLDVAAGAGDPALDIARRVRPGGRVLATDLSPAILRFAQDRARAEGLAEVETRVGDGERLPVDDASFDAVVCRLGLMLFLDPLAGLREMHRALVPGGRAVSLVFASPASNPCVATLLQVAQAHARVPPRDPFAAGGLLSLGKPGAIDELYRRAGFDDVATIRLSAPFRLPSAAHYLAFVRASASPIQQILATLPNAAQQAAWAEMEARLRMFETPEGWAGPNELLLTAGRSRAGR